MLIGELLHAIGIEGQIILLVTVLVGLYHFREALQAIAIAGTWLQMLALVGALAAIAVAGAIPGVHVMITEQFFHLINSLWTSFTTLMEVVWAALA